MFLSRPLILAACVLTLSLAAGCGDACLSLAEQVCGCQPDPISTDNCNQRAKDAKGIFGVNSSDEAFCQAQLDNNACDCTKLDTADGRVKCGIAFPSDAGTH
jgi:hypothetical protein